MKANVTGWAAVVFLTLIALGLIDVIERMIETIT